VTSWSFLTSHARVLLCIARDPGTRLRDIAASLDITERSAHGIVTDLTAAGYVIKHKDGRRNRYQVQAHLPLPETRHPRTRPPSPNSWPSSRARQHPPALDAQNAQLGATPTASKPSRTWPTDRRFAFISR
jgi:Winged helix DNA-binding domain